MGNQSWKPAAIFGTYWTSKLFTLKKLGQKDFQKLSTRHDYSLQVESLPCILSPETSIRVLPKFLEIVFNICMGNFSANDRVQIFLNLAIYLSMQKLSDFSVAALMQQMAPLNSRNKFKMDLKFGFGISSFAQSYLLEEAKGGNICTCKLTGNVLLNPS